MPDRIIRDELLQSDRWLDLPSDTHRLVYENLLLIADDYANLKGGPRRLFRWMASFSQVKTEADSIKLMSDLQDADLVRRYEVSGDEYWHLPRFKNSRKYWARKWPASPFPESIKKPSKQKTTENPDPILTPPEPHISGGVGVGVGEQPSQRPTPDPRNAAAWLAFSDAYAKRYGVAPVRNASVNTCIANLVKRLGDEAAPVAAFYLTHNDSFYIKKQHSAKQLLADCEGLRTQWKRGRKVTGLEARSAEQKDSVLEQIKRLNGD